MEVTEKNLQTLLPEIQKAIFESTFLSIDTEFSGLTVKDSTAVRFYDTPAEAYAKLRGASGFAVLQFGLCTFHESIHTPHKFTHQAFNFYILPSQSDFVCQTESIVFLAKCGLDLNKIFKDGITSMTYKEKEEQLAILQDKRKSIEATPTEPKTAHHIVNVPEKEKDLMNATKEKIEEFLSNSEEESLVLDKCNGFQRLLLYQLLEAEFDGQAYMITRNDTKRNRECVVFRGGLNEKRAAELEQISLKEKWISECSGFSAILSAIKNSGKLMVGHNMILDIMHTLHQFYDDIPQDLPSFKSMVHSKFPLIIDTKMMACKKPLKDIIDSSVLEQLVKCLTSEPFKLVDAETAIGAKGYSLRKDQSHEAGYDAYITGLCFIAMTKYLDSSNQPFTKILQSDALKFYVNKLLFAPFADNGYFDLCAKEPPLQTNHMFHMEVPSDWKSGDVAELFSPYGSVRIIWQGKEDCLVVLDKREEASRVKEVMEKASRKSKKYKFQTFAKYKEKFNSNNSNHEGRRRRTSDNNPDQSFKKLKNANGTFEGNQSESLETQPSVNKLFEESAAWD